MKDHALHVLSLLLPAAVCLSGCPQADNSRSTTTIAVIVSTIEVPSFLDLARAQPLTPAEAALLHIVESPYSVIDQKVDAAKALAEIEKARIALQSRELNRRLLEVERR